jgi:hypothetical protein
MLFKNLLLEFKNCCRNFKVSSVIVSLYFAIISSWVLASPFSREEFVTGAVKKIPYSKSEFDSESRVVYMPIMATYPTKKIETTSGQKYQSIRALLLVDCDRGSYATVDHEYFAHEYDDKSAVAYDAISPADINWSKIDSSIESVELFKNALSYCWQ